MTLHPDSMKAWSQSSRQVAEELDEEFPRSDWTSTYPGHDPSEAWAIDLMCSKSIGDKIAAYAWKHRERLGIWYIIWWGRIISMTRPQLGWQRYWDADNPNPSKSHKNHVHISRYVGRGYTAPAGSSKPDTPEQPEERDWVVMYADDGGAKGYYATRNPSPVKHRRKAGFRIRGYWVQRSDGRYLRTRFGTDYPSSDLTAKKPAGPKKYTLWLVRDTYWYDGTGKRRGRYNAGHKLVGYIDKKKFKDGRYLRVGKVPHRQWFPMDLDNMSHDKGGKSLQDD